MVKLPRGYKDGKRVKIAVSFTPEVFERVLMMSRRTNIPFSETMGDIIKCGLLCLEESDALEPTKLAS